MREAVCYGGQALANVLLGSSHVCHGSFGAWWWYVGAEEAVR